MGSTEFHTGYRVFSKMVLEQTPWMRNSKDFVFDNQMLAQIIYKNFRIAEVTCPAKYFEESSSINFRRSIVYGIGCLVTAVQFRLSKMSILRATIFDEL
jgi:hypothetical protein